MNLVIFSIFVVVICVILDDEDKIISDLLVDCNLNDSVDVNTEVFVEC